MNHSFVIEGGVTGSIIISVRAEQPLNAYLLTVLTEAGMVIVSSAVQLLKKDSYKLYISFGKETLISAVQPLKRPPMNSNPSGILAETRATQPL